ncbi:MAG TPA: GNAT family N-acetyltransferase [Kofleriaceae bacterium]|jgi:GNAT superfamily N-acetyltransferase
MSRFAIRAAAPDDAEGIASSHAMSWATSYRGILPDRLLDRIDVGQRAQTRRRMLADPALLTLVAYDVTHGDIVGFCDAGPCRERMRLGTGEIYAFYLEHHAKRHGLGTEMFEQTCVWLRGRGLTSLVIWVLENNPHACRFYEAMGGELGGRMSSAVGGFPVVEIAYLWRAI